MFKYSCCSRINQFKAKTQNSADPLYFYTPHFNSFTESFQNKLCWFDSICSSYVDLTLQNRLQKDFFFSKFNSFLYKISKQTTSQYQYSHFISTHKYICNLTNSTRMGARYFFSNLRKVSLLKLTVCICFESKIILCIGFCAVGGIFNKFEFSSLGFVIAVLNWKRVVERLAAAAATSVIVGRGFVISEETSFSTF